MRIFFSRFSVIFKLAIIGILLLLMLIPLGMVQSKLNERQGRRDEAVKEISGSWSYPQQIVGPILMVPYIVTNKTVEDRLVKGKTVSVEVEQTFVRTAYFLPKILNIKAQVEPKLLHRGIYDAVVYHSDCEVSGEFDLSEWNELKISEASMQWKDARVCMVMSDLRGVRENIGLNFGGGDYLFKPGSMLKISSDRMSDSIALNAGKGIHASIGNINVAKTVLYPFAVKLSFNGSSDISFAPVGKESKVEMISTWPDPSFNGRFLPTNREINADGFKADWQLSYYGRNYPQQWVSSEGFDYGDLLAGSLFGVELKAPVDNYRQVERSVKYATLFIVLIFTAYFLFEVLSKQKIHPFQYILVGAAICLFYLGILSLSELMSFGPAFWISSLVSWAMISLYTLSILKSGKKTVIIATILAFIQAFLYVVLQMQDYSLVFGTALLFVVLAAVMYVTRRVDWYNNIPVSQPPPLP